MLLLCESDFADVVTLKNKLDSFFIEVSSSEESLRNRRVSLLLIDAIIDIQDENTLLKKVVGGLRSALPERVFEHRKSPVVAKFVDKFNLITESNGSGFTASSEESVIWAAMELTKYMRDLIMSTDTQ
jgi:hypothetical protein